MNTIILVLSALVLGLVVMAKIPGLEHMVRPVIDILFTLLKLFFANASSWAIWLFKTLWRSHIELIKHLLLKDEAIDPLAIVRKNQQ